MSVQLKTASDLYAELCDLPPHVTGEIIGGVLYTQPRPAGPHYLTASDFGGVCVARGLLDGNRLVSG